MPAIKTLIAALALSSSAHAWTTDAYRMDINDLDTFVVDCSVKEQQLAFLASQLPNRWEVFKNDMFGNSLLQKAIWQYNGTYENHKAVRDRRQLGVIKFLMHDIVYGCNWQQPVQKVSAQCVQTTDDTIYGKVVSKQCWDGNADHPVIDNWEVD